MKQKNLSMIFLYDVLQRNLRNRLYLQIKSQIQGHWIKNWSAYNNVKIVVL